MQDLYQRARDAAEFIRGASLAVPRLAVVLGSGLGGFAGHMEVSAAIPYGDIPHFPRPTVEGHSGRLILGSSAETPVAVMQGRVHGYEGYTPAEVTFPIRVLGLLGVRTVILTNAAGAINPAYRPGSLVLLRDHINFTGTNPLVGPNDSRFGPRFFDMTEAYSVRLRNIALAAAESQNLALEQGVYLSVSGPSYETPAEIRAFRALGADLVGMSTVHEAIVARHMGMQVLGISCVTNMAAGILNEPINHEEVMEMGRRIEHQLASLLHAVIPEFAAIAI